jgi:hypothetical protein
MENSMEDPYKLKIDPPCCLVIPLLRIYPKKCESAYNEGTHTPMFITSLFTAGKLWKQPRCPTNDKWIKNMWYLYTMKFYSTTKKNEV